MNSFIWTCLRRIGTKEHQQRIFLQVKIAPQFSAQITPCSKIHTGHAFTRMAQRKVNVSGTGINIEQVGTGEHPLLLLPGALGCIESDFGPLLPKFDGDKFTVVAWDPPGYGKSRPPDRDFSGGVQFFYRDAEKAHELMKTLGFSEYSLLGWSDGANTACVQAAKFPEAVRKLVIWGGNAYVTDADMKLYDKVANIDNWSPKMKAPLIKTYGEDYFRKSWNAWIDAFREILKSGGDIYTKELPKIQCPTFILHGMKDAMVPYEHPEYFQKSIKNSLLLTMPDGKHNLHLRYADDFIKLVENFLHKESFTL